MNEVRKEIMRLRRLVRLQYDVVNWARQLVEDMAPPKTKEVQAIVSNLIIALEALGR